MSQKTVRKIADEVIARRSWQM